MVGFLEIRFLCYIWNPRPVFFFPTVVWLSHQAPTKLSFLPNVPYSFPFRSLLRRAVVIPVLLRNHLLFLSVWTRKQQRFPTIC